MENKIIKNGLTKIFIDLQNLEEKSSILKIFGNHLGYGYLDSKLGINKDSDWGENWDAFNDILRYLDDGGIFGCNQKIKFPVVFEIKNFENFKNKNPENFNILFDILNSTKSYYSKENLSFEYKFN